MPGPRDELDPTRGLLTFGTIALLGGAAAIWAIAAVAYATPSVAAVTVLISALGISLAYVAGKVSSGSAASAADQVGSSWRRQLDRVRSLTIYDEIPGLYTRWYFEFRLQEEAQRCKRYGLSYAVAVIQIEDRGSLANIREADLADKLRRIIRPFDIVARLDFGEYALCLMHCDLSGAEAVSKRVLRAIDDLRLAIGVSICPGDAVDCRDLIQLARERAREQQACVAA